MDSEAARADPILEFINDSGGLDPGDDFLMHMISLTDVVKNDMKKTLNVDEENINVRLNMVIETGLDENNRYTFRPSARNVNGNRKYPIGYIQAQCLVTEWLSLYRTIRVYLKMKQSRPAT